jgi:hypothetical protein
MYLTPSAWVSVMKNGMKLSEVTWVAGGGGISFSSSIREASSYLFQSGSGEGLGVVFEVDAAPDFERLTNPTLNPTNTIYKLQKDLEPGRIRRVYLWGRWGLESLEEVIEKSTAGPFPAHKEWTSVFESF